MQLIFGLKNLSPAIENIDSFLNIISTKLIESTGNFTIKELSCCVYSLQNFNSENKNIKSILSFLTIQFEKNIEIMDGIDFSNSLYGCLVGVSSCRSPS